MKKLLVFDFKNDIGSKITIYVCGHQEMNKIHRYDQAWVYYSDKDRKVCISNGTVDDVVEPLKYALKQKRILDRSITRNIGLMFSEWYSHDDEYRRRNFEVQELEGGNIGWLGEGCQIAGIYNSTFSYNSWLYKKKTHDKQYVFEITPGYPWSYSDPAEDPTYISFEEWAKDYKPVVVTTVAVWVVKDWIKQLRRVVKGFLKFKINVDCLYKRCPYRCRFACCLYPKNAKPLVDKPGYYRK
jgi:hypothetical protein